MTAINIVRAPDAVHFLSDGAVLGPDGALIQITPKVLPLVSVPALIGSLGHNFMLGALYVNVLHHCATFESLIARLPDLCDKVDVQTRGLVQAAGIKVSIMEVLVSGWTGTKFEVWVADNRDAGKWTTREIDDPLGTINPMPATPPDWDLTDFANFDPERHGLALLEAQRASAIDERGHQRHVVGGFAQLTTITRDAIASRILRRWPDQIGAKINPASEVAPGVGESPRPMTAGETRNVLRI